jgi:hypothetical protein
MHIELRASHECSQPLEQFVGIRVQDLNTRFQS